MGEVQESLAVYLVQGYGKAAALTGFAQDEAAQQWAYYRAYDEVYNRRVMYPSTVSDHDEASGSWTADQLDRLFEMRAAALVAFENLVGSSSALSGYSVIRSYR